MSHAPCQFPLSNSRKAEKIPIKIPINQPIILITRSRYAWKTIFIPSQKVTTHAFIFSRVLVKKLAIFHQTLYAYALISSQFLYSKYQIAMSATIQAITRPIGLIRKAIAVPIPVNNVPSKANHAVSVGSMKARAVAPVTSQASIVATSNIFFASSGFA